MHECSRCRITKDWSEFHKAKYGYWKNDKGEGISSQCKECKKIHSKNKTERKREERLKNPKPKKPKKTKEHRRNMVRLWCKKQYETNPQYVLAARLRSRTKKAIKYQGGYKSATTEKLLGCTFEEAKIHIEKQFLEGMSWENHGEWHIDHIRPCASFDLTDPEQQKLCCHYTNLQPLWAHDNLSKHDKWNPE